MNIKEFLAKEQEIYGTVDDRLYELEDLFYYHQKFALRYLDTKAKHRDEIIDNLIATTGWFAAIMNRFNLNLQEAMTRRYSYKCPFCLDIPCSCTESEVKSQKTGRPGSRQPENLNEWQEMLAKIYPVGKYDIDTNLLLRQDNLHQIFRRFRREPSKTSVKEIETQSADYFAYLLRLFNELNLDLGKLIKAKLTDGCYVCHQTPCQCFYTE